MQIIRCLKKKKENLPGWQRATFKQLSLLKRLLQKDFSFIKPEKLSKKEASFMVRTLLS